MLEHLKEEALTDLRTIRDMIRWVASQLNNSDIFLGHGSDDVITEARHLVLISISMPITLSDGDLEARLTKSERISIVELLHQRIVDRIPTAYLTQRAFFAGLMFYVDERVLVPRSPIAQMIETHFSPYFDDAISDANKSNRALRVLDLCTGSGCIAIAVAYALENAIIDAVDISFDALAVSEINIDSHQLSDRVFPIQSDLFDALGSERYDLIVTNPPYVDAEDMSDLPVEFKHEPELGLSSGTDGLDITRRILKEAKHYLTDKGILVCEVGNSMVHLIEAFPDIEFDWVDFTRGGQGVFVLTKAQLDKIPD
ncbi:50S ribosomal protein L3 N(5)-glutamine methyltransferase [Thorsellia anophelis]|uniref:Ribosomal protein uL3 glutamine methyltransferase n=1 Tax=Thorsellia anophelis DSM 18579 TaxID=1123402 RepID=A0A1I0BZY9_9GAMM|nr:50S ribosomal protein L3 N(5)-glutamine methyltransferase [Thorsellia anophelis]SET12583.1 [LSU ribosomal protein L3P]-glutamine N5-methyltransferase [Thorsellia anophelis DSM 18579]